MSKNDLLFLAHRIPLPPNKGDKLRSFPFIKFLQDKFNVHPGCFLDDPEDEKYIDELKIYFSSLFVQPLNLLKSKVKSLKGFLTGGPLTLEYYANDQIQHWVDETIRKNRIQKVLAFSSTMAQFFENYKHLRWVIDFIDIDSDKWTANSKSKKWPHGSREEYKIRCWKQWL